MEIDSADTVSIDSLSLSVRVLSEFRDKLKGKINKDVQEINSHPHAKTGQFIDNINESARNNSNSATKVLAQRLDDKSTEELEKFLSALKLHVVSLDPDNYFHILKDPREHAQLVSIVAQHERDQSITGDMFRCSSLKENQRHKQISALSRGFYVLIPRGEAENQLNILKEVFGADCAPTPRDPTLLTSLTKGTLLNYLKSLKDFKDLSLPHIDDLWECIAAPLEGRPVSWQRFRDIYTSLPGTCESTRLHHMKIEDAMSQSLCKLHVVNELFAEDYFDPAYSSPNSAAQSEKRIEELTSKLKEQEKTLLSKKYIADKQLAAAVRANDLSKSEVAMIENFQRKVIEVRKSLEDIEMAEFGLFMSAKHDVTQMRKTASSLSKIKEAEASMFKMAHTSKQALGVCGADPLPGASTEQVKVKLDQISTTLKSKFTVLKATSASLCNQSSTQSHLIEMCIEICMLEVSIIELRLLIAEQELNVESTTELRSHGSVHYHFEKDSGCLQLEGVFARGNELIHDDDDYESEMIIVSEFHPGLFVHAQNWVYISNHEMQQGRFAKELMHGLYCFVTHPELADLAQLGKPFDKLVALMHASIPGRSVNTHEYYHAKRKAFTFFEVHHDGHSFHDARVCKLRDNTKPEDKSSRLVSYVAWHHHHHFDGRHHLNHLLHEDNRHQTSETQGTTVSIIDDDSASDSESDDSDDENGVSKKIGAAAQWSYEEDDTCIHLRGNFAVEQTPRELFEKPKRVVDGHRMSFYLNLGIPVFAGRQGRWIFYSKEE